MLTARHAVGENLAMIPELPIAVEAIRLTTSRQTKRIPKESPRSRPKS
jgi:hypothetical protein